MADCGACGSECSLDHASNSTCSAGTCSPTCETGFADCNAATANDGCEASLATASNCGTCGYACSHNGSSSQACVDNRCAPTCAPRYADCNATATLTKDDGCELYLDALDRCSNGCDGAGVACGPTQVCNDGGCIAPDGVAVLSVPFTGATQAQRFAELFPPSADLEGTTLTVRAYAPGATGGTLLIYLSDTASNSSVGVLQTDLTTLAAKWIDLTIPVATGGAFNAKSVKQVNLEVNAGPGYANPTVVFVDGIRSSNLAVNDTFSASFGNLVKSSLLVVAGSTIDWTAAVP